MIPTYNLDNLTGNLDTMFQNIMKIGFIVSVVLLTFWIIVSLLIWLFRGQKAIRKSNKIWNKEFYNILNFNNNNFSDTNII